MGALEKNNVMLIEEYPLVIIGLVDDDLCIQSQWLLKQQAEQIFQIVLKTRLSIYTTTTQVLSSTILLEWGMLASHFFARA